MTTDQEPTPDDWFWWVAVFCVALALFLIAAALGWALGRLVP